MQKSIYRSILLLTAIILLATGCGKEKEDKQAQSQTEQKATEVTNNKSEKKEPEITITSDEQEIKIEAGETRVLSYAVTKGGADSALKFTSGDTGKVTVDERGNISGVTEGKTYVVAKCEDAEYYWNVTVLPTAKINTDISEVVVGVYNDGSYFEGVYKKKDGTEEEFYCSADSDEKINLNYSIEGGDDSYEFSIKSLDESVVKVGNDGVITPVNIGSTTVVASYGENVTCSWNVTVENREDICLIVSRIEGDTMYYYETIPKEELSEEYLKENYDEYSLTYNGGGEEKSMILTNDIQYTNYDYDINKDVPIDKEEFVKAFYDDVERWTGYDYLYNFDEYGYFHGFPVYMELTNGKMTSISIPFFS